MPKSSEDIASSMVLKLVRKHKKKFINLAVDKFHDLTKIHTIGTTGFQGFLRFKYITTNPNMIWRIWVLQIALIDVARGMYYPSGDNEAILRLFLRLKKKYWKTIYKKGNTGISDDNSLTPYLIELLARGYELIEDYEWNVGPYYYIRTLKAYNGVLPELHLPKTFQTLEEAKDYYKKYALIPFSEIKYVKP